MEKFKIQEQAPVHHADTTHESCDMALKSGATVLTQNFSSIQGNGITKAIAEKAISMFENLINTQEWSKIQRGRKK